MQRKSMAFFGVFYDHQITRDHPILPLSSAASVPPCLKVLQLRLIPRKIVFLRQMSALIIDAPVGLETGTQQHLAHHLRDHHHANVASQAFMAAKAEMEVVVPVA